MVTSPPRAVLDRAAIVRAAMALLDEEGADGMTMRRLGASLGVQAMSLYRYVGGREDVLQAVEESLIEALPDALDRHRPRSWKDYVRQVAYAVRKIALDHPAIFPLVASVYPATPWLRSPLRSTAFVESFLSTLGDYGFDDQQRVGLYRSLTSFLLGHLLLEASVLQHQPKRPRRTREVTARSGLSPRVHRLQDQLGQDRGAADFEVALTALLDRFAVTYPPLDETVGLEDIG